MNVSTFWTVHGGLKGNSTKCTHSGVRVSCIMGNVGARRKKNGAYITPNATGPLSD